MVIIVNDHICMVCASSHLCKANISSPTNRLISTSENVSDALLMVSKRCSSGTKTKIKKISLSPSLSVSVNSASRV